jgi:signal transduction histidine kinase/ActR/RegA family two-component response regulator
MPRSKITSIKKKQTLFILLSLLKNNNQKNKDGLLEALKHLADYVNCQSIAIYKNDNNDQNRPSLKHHYHHDQPEICERIESLFSENLKTPTNIVHNSKKKTTRINLSDFNLEEKSITKQKKITFFTEPLITQGVYTGFLRILFLRDLARLSDDKKFMITCFAEIFGIHEMNMDKEKKLARSLVALASSRHQAQYLADQAKKAEEIKTKLVATISHEMRTPLHSIMSYSDVLSTQKQYPELQTAINSISDSAKTLLSLINDVLDQSKLEKNSFSLKYKEFNLRNLLLEINKMFIPLAEEKKLTYIYDFNLPTSDIFIGDSLRLKQIICNLLSNSIKFTKFGQTCLRVICPKESPEDNNNLTKIHFYVSDTGIGIPQSFAEQIFQPFFQIEDEQTKQFSGTGLGLTITKMLVELMNGEIKFHSNQQGTTFEIILPMQIPKHSDCQPEFFDSSFQLVNNISILYVDDNLLSQKILNHQLENSDCKIFFNNHPLEALKTIQSSQTVFDIILLDYQMPMMNGLELARTIRQNDKYSLTPIIAVTGDALKFQESHYREGGINDILIKPFSRNELIKTINKWTDKALIF